MSRAQKIGHFYGVNSRAFLFGWTLNGQTCILCDTMPHNMVRSLLKQIWVGQSCVWLYVIQFRTVDWTMTVQTNHNLRWCI